MVLAMRRCNSAVLIRAGNLLLFSMPRSMPERGPWTQARLALFLAGPRTLSDFPLPDWIGAYLISPGLHERVPSRGASNRFVRLFWASARLKASLVEMRCAL